MRFRVALALFVSVLCIGWASWFRLTSSHAASQPALVLMDQVDPAEGVKELLTPKSETTTVTASTTPAKPVTNTDLIGRGLMMDYLSLENTGQATDANIDAIADKYADNVETLHNFKEATYADIKVIPNSKENYQNYAVALLGIYEDYQGSIEKIISDTPTDTTSSNTYIKFGKRSAPIYTNTTKKLESLPVPLALASLHLKLINIYRSNTEAVKEIALLNTKPLEASAGFIAISTGFNEEASALDQIESTIKSNVN